MDTLKGIFGSEDAPQDPGRSWNMDPKIASFPTNAQIKEERAYGTPGPQAGQFFPEVTSKDILKAGTLDKTEDLVNAAKPNPDKPLSAKDADIMYGAKMLAAYSPIASLGFDESRMSISSADQPRLTLGGLNSRKEDNVFAAMRYPSSAVHESIHRGIAKLAEGGSDLAKSLSHYENEIVTRAIMLRQFGDVEANEESDPDVRQAAGAKRHPQIETAAHNLASNPQFVDLIRRLDQEAAYAGAKRNIEAQGGVR